MKAVIEILKEQVANINLIYRLATYEIKGKYQAHYLGAAWQFLSPALQIIVYWFVFGLGIRGGNPVGDTPFFIWLLVGLIPWFFISPSIIQGSNSVYSKVALVSKMKFPVSVLPSIVLVSNLFTFLIMAIFLAIIIAIYGINPGMYIIQLPYYLFALFIFLFAVTLLFSTITTIVRDMQAVLQSSMRMLFYMTPVLWDMSELPPKYLNLVKLNPFYYLIEGFRNTIFGHQWFFEDWTYTLYFWATTLLILFIGANIHVRFRKQFVDYL
jgi:teichoic acid transport system permease protein